jgi:hypothetical protein
MAVSLSDLILWRDRLIESRLSGTRRCRDADGSEIEYRSDQELSRAIAAADAMITAASPPIKTVKFTTTKGL